MATVIRTLGSASDATRSIDTVGGAGPYDLTFDSALNYTPAIGDLVDDSNSDVFVVSGVTSATAVEVTDEFSVGNAPDTGLATVSRAYSSLPSAQTGISSDASAGDTLEWRGYNDSVFTHGILDITDTTLGAGGTLRLTVPTSERHDGTAGTGFRIQFTPGGGGAILGFNSTHAIDLDGIELIGVNSHAFSVLMIQWVAGASGSKIQNCIVHDFTDGAGAALGIHITAGDIDLINCVVYDITNIGSSGRGILLQGSFSGVRVLNCTVNKCDEGMIRITTSPLLQNCASFTGDTSLSSSGWDGASDFNATEQAGAPGGNSLTSLDPADQFVNTADGSEDYSLLLLSDLIDAGTNLSGIFTTDIAGTTRPIGANYDIGAYETQTAPICWQATAIVAGRPWRVSGTGPCPTVIRVPKGAQGVIITDNGQEIHPRIIEG